MLSMIVIICNPTECEEHYMRCYIDEPCDALQIPGMTVSFFQQIKTRHVYKSNFMVMCLELSGKVL